MLIVKIKHTTAALKVVSENPLKNIYRGSQKFPEIINPVNTIMWNS